MDDVMLSADRIAAVRNSLSADEMVTVSGICNRMARILGMLDREGLKQDLAIVHAHTPIDFDALAEADDQLFIAELVRITDATCHRTHTVRENFIPHFCRAAAVA
jgi:hypothetical protein